MSSQESVGSRQCLEGGPAGTNGSGAPSSWLLETDRGSPEPLLVHNLLTNLTTLESLLVSELGREDWLNAFLLAAGMNQIVEDYLHPDPYLLGKAAEYLARLRRPLGPLAAGAARSAGAAAAHTHRRRAAARHLARWQGELAAFVQQLADVVAAEGAATPSTALPLHTSGAALVAALERCPPRLRREVLRLPSSFRSFDQQPADLDRLVRDFAHGWPARERPLAVVGIRTSGSYLAPLVAAFLRRRGYQDVRVLTVRPGRCLAPDERALLRDVARRDGLVLLTDDPPASAGSIAQAARDLERAGVPARAIVLLLQLFGAREGLPPRLHRYAAVLLPFGEWAVHEQLSPPAVRSALASVLAPLGTVEAVERLPLPPPAARGHAHALYRVHLGDWSGGQRREQLVFVAGAGLGYFGAHALAVARALHQFVPEVYGVRAGLLYRAWLPEEQGLGARAPLNTEELAAAMVEYVVTRQRALTVAEDVSLRLRGRLPVWEVAGNLVSRAFGRAWPLARLPIVDPIVQRLLRCERPSVVDGSMARAQWFVAPAAGGSQSLLQGEGGRLRKVDFATRAFSNRDLSCYDPVFDLAGLAASFDVAAPGATVGGDEATLARRLRETYEERMGTPSGAERWLLYQLVHLWDLQRAGDGHRPTARRAMARALQRYFASTFFQHLPPGGGGDLCALDVDGVLETEPWGFPGLTPASALTLRALMLHGYRPVLVTGRSLDEVRERCAAYGLAGGAAEYGAVVYNHGSGRVRPLLSAGDGDDLERLRAALREREGIYLDPDYRYAVRAYRLDTAGCQQSLRPEVIAAAIAASGVAHRIRTIAGEAQTDFMVVGVDKGTGLRALIDELVVDARGEKEALPASGGPAACGGDDRPAACPKAPVVCPARGAAERPRRPQLGARRSLFGAWLAPKAPNERQTPNANDRPVALAVGDTVADLPMFALAARAFAPAHASGIVRGAGTATLTRPYQAGLAQAAAELLGHPPGGCAVCRPPRLAPEGRLLLGVLAAQETGTWGIVTRALLLALRVGTLRSLARRTDA